MRHHFLPIALRVVTGASRAEISARRSHELEETSVVWSGYIRRPAARSSTFNIPPRRRFPRDRARSSGNLKCLSRASRDVDIIPDTTEVSSTFV